MGKQSGFIAKTTKAIHFLLGLSPPEREQERPIPWVWLHWWTRNVVFNVGRPLRFPRGAALWSDTRGDEAPGSPPSFVGWLVSRCSDGYTAKEPLYFIDPRKALWNDRLTNHLRRCFSSHIYRCLFCLSGYTAVLSTWKIAILSTEIMNSSDLVVTH